VICFQHAIDQASNGLAFGLCLGAFLPPAGSRRNMA